MYKIKRFHHHPLSSTLRMLGPPSDGLGLTCWVHEINFAVLGLSQQTWLRSAQGCERLHVPRMIAVEICMAFRRQQVKRRKFQIVERLDCPAILPIGSY